MGQGVSFKSERKIPGHDLYHDLTFSAHTIHCVCHSIRSMFRLLVIYNFGQLFDCVQKKNITALHCGVLCCLVLCGVENEYESCCKSQKMILKLLFLKNMMSLGLCKNKQIY